MILSIESSCDDSSVAITRIDDLKLLFHKKISQEKEHSQYGGVVPELASRLHAVDLPKILSETKEFFPHLKAVAVTNRPGLGVTLLEGIAMAKTLAMAKKIPLIGIHHLKGHIYSLFIEKEEKLPLIVLLISGGHTQLIRVESFDKMVILASTIDDSVGESFDKTAKMMNLGYPGGAIIEALAKDGDENRFDFPVPLRNSPLIAFSLSGLKNAVRLAIESLGGASNLTQQDRCDISASFQKALTLHLIQKSKKVFASEKIKDFAIVGGASANRYIYSHFASLCKMYQKNIYDIDMRYTSDNSAMIGRYGIEAFKRGLFDDAQSLDIATTKRVSVGEEL